MITIANFMLPPIHFFIYFFSLLILLIGLLYKFLLVLFFSLSISNIINKQFKIKKKVCVFVLIYFQLKLNHKNTYVLLFNIDILFK
jgi:hypothetical protein